jgi:hypothetical protein
MEAKYDKIREALVSKNKDTIVEIVEKLFHARDTAHLAHLKTTSYAQHVALNEFYDAILDYADELAETAQGCEGKLLDFRITSAVSTEMISYLKSLKEYILLSRNKVEYEFQKNILDEVTALISKTLYKLTFLK